MAFAFTRRREPPLSEEDVKRLAGNVLEDKRHLQIIAVGQTGMGKTKTVNRTVGTMVADVGRPGEGSTTKAVNTYTRSAHLAASDRFQLSFTDTPGLGDSEATFSNKDICFTIKESIKSDAAAFVIYFIKAGEKQNYRHIEAIKELEEAIKTVKVAGKDRKLDAVVLTNAASLPNFGECSEKEVKETFEDLRQKLLSRWTSKGLKREYEEYLHEEEETTSLPDIKEFDKKADGSSWTKPMKRLVIQIYYRQKNLRGYKQWFRERLNRPHLPVLKIENSIEFDERGKFGMLQFHSKLAAVFGQRSNFFATVFSLMTTKVVTEKAKVLYKTVIQIRPQPEEEKITTEEIEAPEDTSSESTKHAREESNRGLFSRLVGWCEETAVAFGKKAVEFGKQTVEVTKKVVDVIGDIFRS